jgi:hypothetical protein
MGPAQKEGRQVPVRKVNFQSMAKVGRARCLAQVVGRPTSGRARAL